MMGMLATAQTARQAGFLDAIRDFEWDIIGTFWQWFSELVAYHVSVYGWVAYVVIGIIILMLLLMNDMTHYAASLLWVSVVRFFSKMIVVGSLLVAWFNVRLVKNIIVARSKSFFSYLAMAFRKDE